MNHETLIKNLGHPGANVRLGVARVIGMVEETEALDALRTQFAAEQDLDVRNALQWAGRRVKAAAERGYTTLDALLTHYGVYKELRELGDPDEAAKMRTIQNQMENDMLRGSIEEQERQQRWSNNASMGAIGLSLLAGGGGTLFLGGGMGTPAPNVDFGPSGPSRTEIGAKRTPATKPSAADISRPLKKLREAPDALERRRAIVQIGELNNTAALPYLAQTAAQDPDEDVRKMAERWGKLIYWGAIYWQMEQDGSLETLMRKKGKELREKHGLTPDQTLPVQEAPLKQQEDLQDILRRAEEARRRRSQKR